MMICWSIQWKLVQLRNNNIFRCSVRLSTYVCAFIFVIWILSHNASYFRKKRANSSFISLSDGNLVTINMNQGKRLGNRMFQYASLLGIATANKMTAILPADLTLRDIFTISMPVMDYEPYSDQFEVIVEHIPSGLDDRYLNLGHKGNTVIRGYLQSWKYFAAVEGELRQEFRFKTKVTSAAHNFFHDNLHSLHHHKNVHTIRKVGVHVRRADVILADDIVRLGYEAADADYLNRAMGLFRANNTLNIKHIFVVCSDDLTWSKEQLSHHDDVIFSDPTHSAEVDLALLSLCDHMIMTVGTFGWWAGWLSNGTTVYYSKWPRENSRLSRMVRKQDYFPPSWIALP